ncbi:cytochrome P450 [Paenibacillus urinalis]|uniref:Cytochrome P450 n=1 Tax=Paenibacillus urinalis TaxID=521520 RepID=A0AAX3N498_9BACL|nr:cytochrome P450 [Paenibacillus urinalis]WDH84038.1 cytochrome P450 [Paenibacillus urinalis]
MQVEEKKLLPKEEGLDHSLSVLREGYLYITNRTIGFQSDIFETRLLGERAICMRGEEAAKLFYDNDKFERIGAAPKRVIHTLFGEGGVQSLDGEEHHHRKNMFMSVMSTEALAQMRTITRKHWALAAQRWETMPKVQLYEEAQELLCRAACEWAGVPLREAEAQEKAAWFGAMIEATAAIGIKHMKGKNARSKAEKWINGLVEQVRTGEIEAPEQSTLHTFAMHRDLKRELLDSQTAAVEIINILRPIVAIAIYICFTALAVIQQPEERKKLATAEEDYLQNFVQEVRRFYPFFPFLPARPTKDFTWQGYGFEKGVLTLLDLYGTNHHPDLWDNPEKFRPDRFHDWNGSPFNFIPQGGGDHYTGHRCAGEWITIEIMKESLDYLANKMEYDIPQQDLSFSFHKMPSLPHSRIVMINVKAV